MPILQIEARLQVHTYVISMEYSAVNRRRPSRETPLGPGAKKDGCFRRLPLIRSNKLFTEIQDHLVLSTELVM